MTVRPALQLAMDSRNGRTTRRSFPYMKTDTQAYEVQVKLVLETEHHYVELSLKVPAPASILDDITVLTLLKMATESF